jgi:large subunit ribosomal protein L4
VSELLEVVAYTAAGEPRARAVKLPVVPFDGRVHETVMHDAVKAFLANQRQGTAKTKTRGFVSGGNQKPWKQKGTGRARQGSIRAPNWPGGGTVFGPVPRDYRVDLPRKVRRLALHSALNARARERALSVIAPLSFEEPKTKRMAELLGKLGLADRKVLLLLSELKPNVALSARNLQNLDVKRWADANTYDVLHAEAVLVEEPALGTLEQGAEVTVEAPAPKRPKPATPKRTAAPAEAEHTAAAKKKAAAPKAKAPAGKAPAKRAEHKPAAKAKKAEKQAAKAKKAEKKGAARAKQAEQRAAKAKKPAAKKPGKKRD